MSLSDVRNKAKSYFGNVSPSHDWHHVERVYQLSLNVGRQENADLKPIRYASLLHDIGRLKEDKGDIDDHAVWGAQEARTILENLHYEDSFIDQVTHCIESHRYSNDVCPHTLEAKVLSDADNLDALGAIGIARTFSYSGERDRPLTDQDRPPDDDPSEHGQTGLNHLHKKILTLQERMFTETGSKIATRRHQFVEDFIDQMNGEINGKR